MHLVTILAAGCLLLIPSATHSQALFPDQCIGRWAGMMHIWAQGTLRDSVPVSMTIARQDDSTWIWRTEYRDTRRPPVVKDYRLRLMDRARQQYITDEGEGLLLQGRVLANQLFEVYEVGGTLFTVTYRLEGDQLISEISFGPLNKAPAGPHGVTSHHVTGLQRAVLRRQP